MPNFRMNGHPDPIGDESARGYLLRMVDLNGYKGVENICRKVGIKFADKIHVMSRQWEFILNTFTHALYKSSPLINVFEQHWSAKIYAQFDMKMSNLFSVNCRVCPICIKGENGYANADWDFALSTVCIKHKCQLIDTCPHCDVPISWKRSELDRCPKCDKHYSDVQLPLLEKNHPLLKLNKTYKTMDRKSVEQLITACSRMHRPQDNMLSKPSLNLMSLSEINNLLTQALGLMHSFAFRAQYQQWLEDTRTNFSVISADAVQEPYRAFIAAFTDKLSDSFVDVLFIAPKNLSNKIAKQNIVKPITKSITLGVKTARLKNIKEEVNEINLSSQIDSRRLASVLGVSFSSIQHMVDDGVLTPTNVVSDVSHFVFDLSDVTSLVKNISIQDYESNKHLIYLKSLTDGKLLAKFVLKFHHVIELILQQKLSLYFDPNKEGFFNGAVCERDLFEILENRMITIQKRLNVTELSNVLNTSLQCVSDLIDAGIIKVSTIGNPEDSRIKSITKDSLQGFFSKYISINRISFLNGIRVDKTLSLLKGKSIEPCITINDGKTSLYLFRKNTELIQAISSLPQKIS
jgi:hypothetical protein